MVQPTPAAVYVRISQDREGAGLGVERQRGECEALCERLGWTVGEVFVDNDISAYRGKLRKGYERMLEAVKDGRCGAVVAWHPDRLHRSPAELERFIGVIEATGAAVATCQAGRYDLTTATGRMTARIVGDVARHESELKSERLRSQRAQAAVKGRPHVGGRRAYGYDVPRDKHGNPKGTGELVVVEREAAMIREAVARFLAGETLRSLARDWNERGVPSASGGRWTVPSLRTMLAGPHLAGLRVHHGEVIGDSAAPAVISRDDHDQLRALLGNPRTRTRGRPPTSLLGGLLYCARCGGKLHHSRRITGQRRYVCNVTPGSGEGCGGVAIQAEPLEERVTGAVRHALASPQMRQALARAHTRKKGDDPSKLQDDLDALADAAGHGDIPMREYLRARRPLEERRKRALAATDFDASLIPFLDAPDFAEAWETLDDVDAKRAVLAALVEKVTIRPAEYPGAKFNTDRVDITWRA
jgi:DNA invertase Pin-like site-specific DNA recombinase